MLINRKKQKELRDVIIVSVMAIFLPYLSMSVQLSERIYNFCLEYSCVWLAEYSVNFVFLYLAGLLFITYRRWRSAEEKRKELENIISSISPDALLVVDRARNIVMCNASVQRLFGYTADEVVKQKTELLYFDRRSCPDYKHEIYEILEKEGFHIGLATGKKKSGDVFPLEIITGNLSSKQGAVLLIRDITDRKRMEDDLNSAYSELDKKVQERTEGLIKTSVQLQDEIKEHKTTEEALKESEERYRTAIENSNDGITLIKGNEFLYVNKKFVEIFGCDNPEECIGKPISMIVHPDNLERFAEIHCISQMKEQTYSRYEFKGIKKNGESLYIEISETAISLSGEPVSLAHLRDMTERRNLEAQLRHAQKMEAIGQLAGGVAHDFNNILTALIGYGNILQMKMEKDDPLRVYVDQLIAASQSAAQLTHSLLAFSRKQIISLNPCDVNKIIKGVEKLLRRLLTEDIELKIIPFETDLTIVADKTQIEQVLLNLATNAQDAMPQGGTITIETKPVGLHDDFFQLNEHKARGKYALISVSDTGCGMDEKTKDKMFDPFFTTKEVGRGTGLGLSIVYGIIKQHEGYIKVNSESGKGATFYLYFPLTSAIGENQEVETFQLKGGTENILIAEDNAEVRKLMKGVLIANGYTVFEADNGMDATERFMEHSDHIDLVILDVVMPKKNGKEVYEEIKQVKPGIKALFVSGYTREILFEKGVYDNQYNFLPKPLSPNMLLVKIREVLDK